MTILATKKTSKYFIRLHNSCERHLYTYNKSYKNIGFIYKFMHENQLARMHMQSLTLYLIYPGMPAHILGRNLFREPTEYFLMKWQLPYLDDKSENYNVIKNSCFINDYYLYACASPIIHTKVDIVNVNSTIEEKKTAIKTKIGINIQPSVFMKCLTNIIDSYNVNLLYIDLTNEKYLKLNLK